MQEKPPTKKAPKEQHPLKWLFGFKETPDEAAATKKRKDEEQRTREVVQQAIRGYKVAKKVVDSKK